MFFYETSAINDTKLAMPSLFPRSGDFFFAIFTRLYKQNLFTFLTLLFGTIDMKD